MTMLTPRKEIERDLADMRALGVCTRLPAFCCRHDPARRCDLKARPK